MLKGLIYALLFVFAMTADLQYCPDSYFFDTQHCQTCTPNCICSAQNTCSQCIQGYTMYENNCIQCPQSSEIYGTCSGCCSRTQGTILSCTDCEVVSGYYSFLFSGRCILSQGCFQVDKNGFCQLCNTGFYPQDNLCHACDMSCQTCVDSDNCIDCNPGYYWAVTDGGLCSACPTGCATCVQSDDQTLCQSCLNQYYFYEDHCLQCPSNCQVCIDGSTCTSCTAGILVSNLCIECTDSTYGGSTGCLVCQDVNNFIECTECDGTYYLDTDNGVCRQCSSSITGASRCKDENTPTQCLNDYDPVLANRYYLVGISCVHNLKNCKKIADIDGNCSSCYDGYIIQSGECVECTFTGCQAANSTVVSNVCTCTQCQPQYYLSGVQCLPCSTAFCSVCAADTCTACVSGYYWAAGLCSVATVANCTRSKANSGTLCEICDDGLYLGSDELCYECQQNCETCTDRFTCTSCMSNYHLSSGKCIVYPSNCIKLVSSVTLSALKCELCEHGYYLVNGFCKQCDVKLGTLSKCDGLCPIDYYIESLLPTVNYGFQFLGGYFIILLLVVIL